ncbi:MAG: hypothetical protein HY646_01815 [Acidobacteria bacterium]|nr:hypothetical protein [Acidobacteriota bacterium]
MRNILTVLVVLSVAIVPASGQDRARAVVDKMIEALGGQAFLDINDIKTTGRFFIFTKGELSGADEFADYIKFPDMERTEFGKDKKKLTIDINKGDEGWTIENKEVTPQSPERVEDFLAHFKTSFDYVLRFVVNHRQTTLQSLGGEIIDFKRVDIVEMRDPEKNRIRFYVDRQSSLPVKMQVRRVNDNEVHEELYGNWHKFQGVMTPLFLARYTDGLKRMEIRAETAEYNSNLPDSLFAPPAAK